MRDDLGADVAAVQPVRRVVSLVPSLTEAIAATDREALVGATDWCTHPADLDVRRVRGTKNPDVRAVVDIAPDLVVANQEENRELDVRRLREAGVPVWVTVTETVPQAIDRDGAAVRRGAGLGACPTGCVEVRAAWDVPVPAPGPRVVVPIWRDPWMVVGRDTFTGDLVRRLAASTSSPTTPTATPGSSSPRSTATTSTWCCCPTSPTSSPPTTGRRRSPGRRPACQRTAADLVRPGPARGGSAEGPSRRVASATRP